MIKSEFSNDLQDFEFPTKNWLNSGSTTTLRFGHASRAPIIVSNYFLIEDDSFLAYGMEMFYLFLLSINF